MNATIGCLLIDLVGTALTPEERELLAHPLVGGVVIFGRNYETSEQIQALCQAIKATRKTPLLITVDQEGGRVQRFIKQFTRIPPMSVFGDLYTTDRALTCARARDCAWLLATELLAVNVDLTFAPVLDLNHQVSSVIGDRAFAHEPQAVSELTSAFVQGLHEAGMASVGKHFPGHGFIAPDSHVAKPVDLRSFDHIQQQDMQPFAALIQRGIDALMTSHILFPQVDTSVVTFSRKWLHTILREQLKFTGTIFTDDLGMEGANISTHYTDRVLAAREAGCDFTLLCNNRTAVIQVIDEVQHQQHQVAPSQWQPLLGKFNPAIQLYKTNTRWQQTTDFLSTFTTQTT